MDVHPTKNVSIGIDPYPHFSVSENFSVDFPGTLFFKWLLFEREKIDEATEFGGFPSHFQTQPHL